MDPVEEICMITCLVIQAQMKIYAETSKIRLQFASKDFKGSGFPNTIGTNQTKDLT